jgi:hypothetical protein
MSYLFPHHSPSDDSFDPTDFRSRRYKLPAEAFALVPDPEPVPGDLIDRATWTDLTWLADDVSFRTSDHHGALLRNADEVYRHWVGFVLDVQALPEDPREDALALASLVVGDELQASLYLALTGFYRQSISILRFALEAVLAGAYFRAAGDDALFRQWADGHRDGQLWVKVIRSELRKSEPYSRFEGAPRGRNQLMSRGGWVDRRYAFLSGFSHGRLQVVNDFGDPIPSTNTGLWSGSSGPVHEARSVRIWSVYYFDLALLFLILYGLADPRLLALEKPQAIPFLTFAKRLFEYHPAIGVEPVAVEIMRYLDPRSST